MEVVAGDLYELDPAALGGPFDLAYSRLFLMHQADPVRIHAATLAAARERATHLGIAADKLDDLGGMRVLDVGSGAGDVGRLRADMVGTSGTVTGTPAHPPCRTRSLAGSPAPSMSARPPPLPPPRKDQGPGTR